MIGGTLLAEYAQFELCFNHDIGLLVNKFGIGITNIKNQTQSISIEQVPTMLRNYQCGI